MKLRMCLSLFLLFFLAMPALAQSDSKYEVSAGYSFLREEFASNRHGMVLSYAQRFSDLFGFKTEVGGNYDKDSFPVIANGGNRNDFIHSILAGPQFKLRRDSRIQPWAHVLAGITLANVSRFALVGTPSGQALVAQPVTNVRFGFQPGGGIDLWMSEKVGLRLGVDYRRAVSNGADRDFFRLQSGIVFRFGQ
jgi:hypothetical protein